MLKQLSIWPDQKLEDIGQQKTLDKSPGQYTETSQNLLTETEEKTPKNGTSKKPNENLRKSQSTIVEK